MQKRKEFLVSDEAREYLIAAHSIATQWGVDRVGELKDEIAWMMYRFHCDATSAKKTMLSAIDSFEKTKYMALRNAAIRLLAGTGLEGHDFPCGCCVCELIKALD